MSLRTEHPLYQRYSADWVMMRDLYNGERVIKAKGTDYLPSTSGMELDGMQIGQPGQKAYDAYKLRAVVPDYFSEGIEAFIGLLCQSKTIIDLPPQMEPLRENATLKGESLQILLRSIWEEQLITGRVGLLSDLPVNAESSKLPYTTLYCAEAILNWDDGSFIDGISHLNLVVLNETGYKRTDSFEWVLTEKFRVLQLGDLNTNEVKGIYLQGVFEGENFSPENMISPMFRGRTLKEIPFTVVNSKDLVVDPDKPPLAGLGRACLSIYRSEADYRQNLFMQGQDTLVVIGGINTTDDNGEPLRTGAGSRIDVDINGDAKYVGVQSSGLFEQREALSADRKEAAARAGKLIDSGKQKESGEALQTRLAAQTASLNQIAITGAGGLEKHLKCIARWIGADENKVKVHTPTGFTDIPLTGKDIVQLMTAKKLGAPLSDRTIHDLMATRNITNMDFEEEMKLVDGDTKKAMQQAQEMLKIEMAAKPPTPAPGAKKPAQTA